MDHKKIIYVIIILVVIVVAGAAIYVAGSDDDSDNDTVDRTGRLMVLGNANDDDVIDQKDIDTLKDIIDSGTWDKETYPYADANNDGSITQADVDMVEKILDKSVGRVNYVNVDGEIESSHYPISKFVCVGSFPINAMIVLNQDKCVGVSGSATFGDELYWTGIQDIPKISNNATKADYELVTKIPGVQAIFYHNGHAGATLTNAADFLKADIDIIKLDYNGPNELSAIMIMGFLIDEEQRYLSIAEAYDAVTDKAKEVVANHPEMNGKTALISYNNLTIYSDIGAQGWICNEVGLSNAWKFDSSLDTKEYLNAKNGDSEWYLNDRFACEYIIGLINMNYDRDASADNVLSQMNQYFAKLDAYPGNTVIINSSIPLLAKTAYLLEGLFPEDVGEGYGDSVLQAYLEEFNPSFVATGYDVSKDGLFLVTPEEVKAYADSHRS